MPTFPAVSEQSRPLVDWLRERLGTKNWIVARATTTNRVRYGDDAKFLTAREFNALKAEYHEGADA